MSDPVVAAPWLLGKLLVSEVAGGEVSGRIVEVEAYRGEADPASHASRGQSPRNTTMFGRPGLLYVYFTYGMHYCCNVVCWPSGRAGALLIRALAPISGLELMSSRRGLRWLERDLCSGPARLTQALGIDRGADGVDLLDPASRVRLCDDGYSLDAAAVSSGPRIGIASHGSTASEPWRYFVRGDPNVSRPTGRGAAQVAGPAPRSTTS